MLKLIIQVIVFALFILNNIENIHAQNNSEPIIVSSSRDFNSIPGQWIKLIYTEAFRRLNIKYEFVVLPSERAIHELIKGNTDMDVARVYSFGENYPELIRAEPAIAWIEFSAYSADPEIHLDGWESLKGKDYRIDYINGAYICKIRLAEVADPDKITAVDHLSNALNKLNNNRTDIYIGLEVDVASALNNKEYKGFTIFKAGIMERIGAYAYFHKKNKDLVPKFEAVIREMMKEGLIEKYKKKALNY